MPHRPDKTSRRGSGAEMRTRIAIEAARIIAESGVRDYAFAKQKAAQRLGIDDEASLPKNSEVEEALRIHQRLFHASDQPQHLRRLRETAAEAMRFLREFEPRLVGAVLDGSADEHSSVCLHLFSDDPDAPLRFLDEHAIRYESQTRRLRTTPNDHAEFPALTFAADTAAIDLTIFALDEQRRAPIDRVTGKPMLRADSEAVRNLLESTPSDED
jgi:hypothetical protein